MRKKIGYILFALKACLIEWVYHYLYHFFFFEIIFDILLKVNFQDFLL